MLGYAVSSAFSIDHTYGMTFNPAFIRGINYGQIENFRGFHAGISVKGHYS
jgi:hypothetical protein